MTPPLYPSQVEDIQSILDHPCFALLNKPGTGKSRTLIEAAAELYRRGEIDTVFVIAPAQARNVWAHPDPVIGEVAKWASTTGIPFEVEEYHSKDGDRPFHRAVNGLHVIVTNPEFVRQKGRLTKAVQFLSTRRPMLVIEESWWMRSPSSLQTKAAIRLRHECRRVVALNGTPGDPSDLFSMFHMFDPGILGVNSFFGFKARYTTLGGFMGKEIVGYSPEQRAEFARRTAPYAVSRMEATWTTNEPIRTFTEARLRAETWKLYRDMREDCVARLEDESSVAVSAGVSVMRLSQLTAGILGGLQADGDYDAPSETRTVSSEKIENLITLMKNDPQRKVVVFCKFRREIENVAAALAAEFPAYKVVRLWGGQDRTQRADVQRLFAPGGDPHPAIVVAHPASGGVGINLAQAGVTYFMTNDYDRRVRTQAEGRTHRPGQQGHPRFVDVLATGPAGEQTVDHVVMVALRRQRLEQT
jgi:SNF2 family DNA or RNA helicase